MSISLVFVFDGNSDDRRLFISKEVIRAWTDRSYYYLCFVVPIIRSNVTSRWSLDRSFNLHIWYTRLRQFVASRVYSDICKLYIVHRIYLPASKNRRLFVCLCTKPYHPSLSSIYNIFFLLGQTTPYPLTRKYIEFLKS